MKVERAAVTLQREKKQQKLGKREKSETVMRGESESWRD
jgi:hypothetical protein